MGNNPIAYIDPSGALFGGGDKGRAKFEYGNSSRGGGRNGDGVLSTIGNFVKTVFKGLWNIAMEGKPFFAKHNIKLGKKGNREVEGYLGKKGEFVPKEIIDRYESEMNKYEWGSEKKSEYYNRIANLISHELDPFYNEVDFQADYSETHSFSLEKPNMNIKSLAFNKNAYLTLSTELVVRRNNKVLLQTQDHGERRIAINVNNSDEIIIIITRLQPHFSDTWSLSKDDYHKGETEGLDAETLVGIRVIVKTNYTLPVKYKYKRVPMFFK
jgi:hypothetical protein